MVNIEDAKESEHIFNSLSHNGVVRMSLQETFWAKRFGMLPMNFEPLGQSIVGNLDDGYELNFNFLTEEEQLRVSRPLWSRIRGQAIGAANFPWHPCVGSTVG